MPSIRRFCTSCLWDRHECEGGSCECLKCARPKPAASGLTWRTPPPHVRQTSIISPEQRAELVKNPGRWAEVRKYAGKHSANEISRRINRGEVAALTSDEWEADYEIKENGSVLFLRFKGKANG